MRPLLSALLRNKTGPILVALQVTLALAVCVNAVYIVAQRIERINRPSGLDVQNIFWLWSSGYSPDFNYPASVRADLQLINSLPGVVAATTSMGVPLGGGGSNIPFFTQPGQKGVKEDSIIEMVTDLGVKTLGVKLIAGRSFNSSLIPSPAPTGGWAQSMASIPPEVIVTQALGKKLFPNENPLGKTIYGWLDRPARIVGIMERMQGPWPQYPKNDQVALLPAIPTGPAVVYLVRTEPGRRDALMRMVEDKLAASQPGRMINVVSSLEKTANLTHMGDKTSAILLAMVAAAVLAVAALGIFGLSMFNVTARTKQIGTRRAIGARKIDIIRYFLVENWMISTAGILVGCALALAVGLKLSSMFQMPRLPLYYLVLGVVGLWMLGLAAAWFPARRAAAISPAVATRTV